MKSSYAENNYDEVFYAIVRGFKPLICVELGVLHGYSACAIGRALKDNKQGHLDAYSLFEDYPYNHGIYKEVQDNLILKGLKDYITLHKEDACRVHERYAPGSVYLLHVDLSNDGRIIKDTMARWHEKIVIGGIILFEGGTEERDQIDWMKKYKKLPIKPEIETNKIINDCYVYATYLKFPGLTMLLKKRNSEND